ncbi:MAG: hypothetical protein OXC26_08840 [Albidovulum sp.]|nr:hypothetical protein [Albidovulum sp.]
MQKSMLSSTELRRHRSIPNHLAEDGAMHRSRPARLDKATAHEMARVNWG